MDDSLDTILANYGGDSFDLIPILQAVQHKFGYLPEPEMKEVARFVGLPESRIYAVATFYEQFRFTPMGKNVITVCRGTACHVRGAKKVLEEYEDQLNIKEGETTEDLEYTLGTAACIGCCALAPCVMINEEVEAKLTPNKVAQSFRKEKTK
ncbi:MAG: NADH-quinone oxidoreductase subunit NuoE [Desulfobacterales bacterium]|nr:NADH-quinone oxidoreductase subunit NuoE [Desulfobacterales bacterium]